MAMLSDDDRRKAAALLAEAERAQSAIDPLTELFPGIDADDAYQVQLHNVRARTAGGARVRGHKVGLSAKAMQQMLGVDEPDYGHLLDDMFVFEGGEIPAAQLLQPRVEPELAFILGAPLRGPGCTAADVLRATDYVVPALEIVDSRIRDWKIKLADTIADNASSCRVVLGASPVDLADIDPRLLGATLRVNGEIVETGATGAVLGNPVTAVAWLANKVHGYGVTLDPGHVILPGACTKAPFVKAGDAVRADFDGVGHVAVRFT
jgi:2-keto-4-pentenoate hydratase